jgi:CheY-like chemotaxis protein/anti-sigma regulatory factor (Ser/Thr protein kinase)
MKQIYSSAERAKDLVRQILTFARAREEKKIPLRLSLILKEALKFLRATIPSTIEIQHILKTGRDTVMADPTQIHQIVMNLCTNAAHAMKDTGGRLTVSLTEACEVPGDFLRISVKDTGKGIEPGILERIFDPYFTTKGPGQGTGLGLAVVHGIVESCGGRIDVESEVGKGTVFHVLLPVVDSDVSLNEDVGAEAVGGTERILLVDDEDALLKILRRMLERLGYRVTAANNGSEALNLFRLAPSSFDLVITDQTMPGLRGSDLAGEIIAVRNDIPVILCTGFSDQIDEASAFEMGIRAFVSKPVVMHEMATRIRESLEQNIDKE